jgi:cobalt-precorrin 5A hydrolase
MAESGHDAEKARRDTGHDIAVIALPHFAGDAARVASFLKADSLPYSRGVFQEVFSRYRRIVALMSAGIVVRGIAPLLSDKWSDPAIVVVSPDLRYAIPLTGGHHGANELASRLAGMGMVPVISTATEATGRISVEGTARATGTAVVNRDSTRSVNAALLDRDVPVHAVEGPAIVIAPPGVSVLVRDGEYTVGVGCRRGVRKGEVIGAITAACSGAGIRPDRVQAYATTARKTHEKGLIDAIVDLGGSLIFLDDAAIHRQPAPSPSAAGRLGLAGVAEPCALAISRKKELVWAKENYGRVTVAIAR